MGRRRASSDEDELTSRPVGGVADVDDGHVGPGGHRTDDREDDGAFGRTPGPLLPGRAAGWRVSNRSVPPGTSDRWIASSVADQSCGWAMACATLAVMVATSRSDNARTRVSPSSHRTRSEPGLARATASDAAAGSRPTTSNP